MLVDIRYQARKLEMIASDYGIYQNEAEKKADIEAVRQRIRDLTDGVTSLLNENVEKENPIEREIVEKYKIGLKFRDSSG